MRNTLCATALLTIALLGAGCKKASPLVGKWTGPVSANAAGGTATYEFKPEGGFSLATQQGPATITMTGDYKLDGENVTITMKDVQATGLPEQAKAFLPMIKKSATAKPLKAKLKVVSNDEVSLEGIEGGKGAATLTRVKEGA